MTYLTHSFNLNKLNPFVVGFDTVFKDLQEMVENKHIGGYPPYNIRQIDENNYVIELAVSGFSKSDIDITLEGNNLIVKGSVKESTIEEGTFLHKGIANRNFNREFKLADKIEIKDAELTNGMLKIWLQNPLKSQDLIKKISIKEKKD